MREDEACPGLDPGVRVKCTDLDSVVWVSGRRPDSVFSTCRATSWLSSTPRSPPIMGDKKKRVSEGHPQTPGSVPQRCRAVT